MKEITPQDCMPKITDYTFAWWAHGWRGAHGWEGVTSFDKRDLPSSKDPIICFQTGEYGMAINVEKVQIVNLGAIEHPKTYAEAASQGNKVIFELPKGDLKLTILAKGKKYTCVKGGARRGDWLDVAWRMIENGRLLQRFEIAYLLFQDDRGEDLKADARLEIGVWPDRLSFLLEIFPEEEMPQSQAIIDLNVHGRDLCCESAVEDWKPGEKASVALWETVAREGTTPSQIRPEHHRVRKVEVTDINTGQPVNVTWNQAHDFEYIDLPNDNFSVADDLDHLDRFRVKLTNSSDIPETFRLFFARDHMYHAITGTLPMLRDMQGNATGIPVQLCKNWHSQKDRHFPHEGPWYHGFSLLRLPPQSTLELEYNATYCRWGGVPPVSHAMLCLIGYGVNQLWDQIAIGAWGEQICYDPDVNLTRSMIDDVRPLMVTVAGTPDRKYGWTNNVGGGDFLVYHDDKNVHHFLARMRTAYFEHGPCLSDVLYSGVTADGNIAAKIQVASPRSEDFTRAFHRFRYDVLKRTPFKRLAFYQAGSDRYNENVFSKIAIGDEGGVMREWTPNMGGSAYDEKGIVCQGHAPWVSMHEAVNRDEKGGGWASRGVVIRSWKARLGGREIPLPIIAVYKTDDGQRPSCIVEIAPPSDLTELHEGDFVEAEVEFIIIPLTAAEYYGPNENFRAALEKGANTWKPVLREAAGNNLKVHVTKGKLMHNYPIAIDVAADESAEFEVTGGIGYVPVSFNGLSNYQPYELRQEVGGEWKTVDQSVHGKDFWQADYDSTTKKWKITYNVLLDSPGDERSTVRFAFGKK